LRSRLSWNRGLAIAALLAASHHARFFAGIGGVIDDFFDGSEQGFAWVIEAEQSRF